MIIFKLTKEQKKHLKSIRWLLDESNRRAGRTTLLAYVYIEEALRGRKISIIDHAHITTGAGYMADKMLAVEINRIILENKLPLKINYSSLTLFPT